MGTLIYFDQWRNPMNQYEMEKNFARMLKEAGEFYALVDSLPLPEKKYLLEKYGIKH